MWIGFPEKSGSLVLSQNRGCAGLALMGPPRLCMRQTCSIVTTEKRRKGFPRRRPTGLFLQRQFDAEQHLSEHYPVPAHLQRGGHSTANARALGSHQNDALQNINGTIGTFPYSGVPTGPFYGTNRGTGISFNGGTVDTRVGDLFFDLSRSSARTAGETRPASIALHPRIQI